MKWRQLALALSLPPVLAVAAHFAIGGASRMAPPRVRVVRPILTFEGGTSSAGRSQVRRVGKLLLVRLSGSPEAIGAAHARLLHDDMVRTEAVVWRLLDEKVPNAVARLVLLDVGQFAYRRLGDSMSEPRRRELAAAAEAFRPDPFADRFDVFQRFVYLNALYDISLAYERSPLVGCTTLTFSGAGASGTPLIARAFDFDVDDAFDDGKAVFLVQEEGAIAFASVAWPGLVGVVSGMNREGVAAVVHGARAGPVRTTGEPIVQELRRILSRARTSEEAVRALGDTNPLVSHIVVLSDAGGRAMAVERIPGAPPHVRPLGERAAVTNHLEGPFASDEKNLRVREISSTLARRARGDELVRELPHPASAADAVGLLRDRRGARGVSLPLGDRRAIDALIATHGVVMETRARRLWVSEGPHLLGRFVAFDLEPLFEARSIADVPLPVAEIPADPLFTSGEYANRRAAPR